MRPRDREKEEETDRKREGGREGEPERETELGRRPSERQRSESLDATCGKACLEAGRSRCVWQPSADMPADARLMLPV